MACNRWITVTTDNVVTVHTTPMAYDDINKAVGGWIEMVPTTGQVTIYCNEEGKLKGLPINPIASAFVNRFINDVIVGDVVFCGPPDENGDETDVPWDVEAMLGQSVLWLHDDPEIEDCPHEHVLKDDDGRDNWFYVCDDCDKVVRLTEPDEDGQSYWEVTE